MTKIYNYFNSKGIEHSKRLPLLLLLITPSLSLAQPPRTATELCRSLLSRLSPSVSLNFHFVDVSQGIQTLRQNLGYSLGKIHEVNSSEIYGRHIKQNYQEQLIFVATVNNRSIPGFDGIITDPSGKPIANYSLKNILGDRRLPIELINLVSSAISKSRRYTRAAYWLIDFNLVDVDDRLNVNESELRLIQDNWLPSPASQSLHLELAQLFHLFGVNERSHYNPRPLRIVIDLGKTGCALPIREIQYLLEDNKDIADEVIFISPSRITHVTLHGVVHHKR